MPSKTFIRLSVILELLLQNFTNYNFARCIKKFFLIVLISFSWFVGLGQTSTQNFGTTASNYSSGSTGSTTYIPNPTSGTTYARTSNAQGGAISISSTSNPLNTSGAFIKASAATGNSVVKISPIVSYTSGTEFYTSFKVLFGDGSASNTATSGIWTFYQGNQGTNYNDNNDISPSNTFTGLRFTYGSSGSLTLTYNNAGNYNSSGLTSSTYSQGTVYTIEIIGNNKTSGTISYSYNGTNQTVAVQKFDVYINNTLVGNDLSEGNLSPGTAINATSFTGVSSTSNTANIFIDDVSVYNSVPSNINSSNIVNSNDSCSSATSLILNATPLLDSAKSFNDTKVAAVSCGSFIYGDANDDVWYKFTTTSAGDYKIAVNPSSGYDAVIDLRSGVCNGTNIDCADLKLAGDSEVLVKTLLASTTYFVRVYDYNSGIPGTKTFTISVSNIPTQTSSLVQWDFYNLGGSTTWPPSPYNPSYFNPNIEVGGLKRSSMLTTTNTAANNAWGASGWSLSSNLANAINDSSFITFSIKPKSGYILVLDSINPYNVRGSSTGPTTGQWQYKINSGSFANLGSSITWGSNTTSSGNTKQKIDFTSISQLRNISSTDTVTFRIVNWGSSGSTGTWYFNDPLASPAADLIVSGQLLAADPTNGAEGDYRTKTSGTWDDNNIWQKYSGGGWKDCATGDFPNNTQSAAIIRSGHTITYNVNSKTVKDLKVDAGGKLFCNSSTVNYLNVFGNIMGNGTIGNGNNVDGLSFNFEGANDTISGNGNISCFNIRKNLTKIPQTNLFITTNVKTTNSFTSIYNASASRFNITIDAMDTLTCLNGGNVSIDGTGLIQTGDASGSILVNGMLITDSLFLQTDNAQTKDSCKILVGSNGVITANTLIAGTSGNAKDSLVILSGGQLNIAGPLGFQNFSNMNNVYYFEPGATVAYTFSGSQTIVTAIPAYPNLVLSGSGIKTAESGNDLTILGNLQIDASFVLSNVNLFLGGNWNRTANGVFNAYGKTVFFNGNTDAFITANGGQYFPNLILNKSNATNTLTLADPLSIGKSFTVTSGTFNLASKDVTLLSNDTSTASFGKVGSNGIVTYGNGRFVVERYIPTGTGSGQHPKSWQFLAVPNNGVQTINQAWQDTSVTANENRYAGYGTQITGPGGIANGFDLATSAPSMKTYNSLSNTWDGIPNTTSTPIYNAKGYMVFVRGDRSVINFNSAGCNNCIPVPTILRTRGKLFVPNSNPPAVINNIPANSFESIGNPYASAIDFSNLIRGGSVDAAFYVWDPLMNGSYNLGAYRTYTNADLLGAYSGYKIQSGQAFFVHTTGGTGSISFNEDVKVSGSAMTNRPPVISPNRQFLRIKLFADTIATKLADIATAVFDPVFSNNYDRNDAFKLINGGENLGLICQNKILAQEARYKIALNDTLFLTLRNCRMQGYQFQFTPTNMDHNSLTPVLIDRFLWTTQEISNIVTSNFKFLINTTPASYASDRFIIVFKKKKSLISSKMMMTRSAVENIKSSVAVGKIAIKPNPVRNGKINIHFEKMPVGNYTAKLLNINGQILQQEALKTTNPSENKIIILYKIPKGVYQIQLISENGQQYTEQILLE